MVLLPNTSAIRVHVHIVSLWTKGAENIKEIEDELEEAYKALTGGNTSSVEFALR